ncbi:hypothetical protein ACFXPV_24640 [Streptomyces sp. NPDC059118]|uniref:hypothetical protein n=1 Tax=unclassified Streptomyces TaxID=2593676 RepID=UPI0036D18F99
MTGTPMPGGTILRKLTGNPDCKNGACPTLWATEDEQNYIVQGYVVADPERLAQLALPEGETAVMIPAAMLEEHFDARR